MSAAERGGRLGEATGLFGRRLRAAPRYREEGTRTPAARLRAWVDRQIDIERGARSAFALIPIGMIAGIVLHHGLDDRPPIAVLLGLAAACVALVRLAQASLVGRLLGVLCASVLIAMALANFEAARNATVILSGEATVRIEGRIVWRDRDDRDRYRYLIDVERTQRPVLSRPPGRVRVVVSSRHEPLPIGATYGGLVRLRPPSGPAFPGSYDFAFTPFFGGLGAYGFSLGAPDALPGEEDEARGRSLAERLAALRLRIGERIRDVLPGAEGAVAAALIMGERAGIPEEIDDALRTTGLTHVLSISGFHMALVAGFTMVVVRAALALLPGAALLLPAKKVAAAIALLVSTFYLAMAGGNVATERSYIMLAIMLAAVLVDRPALTLRNVAIAAILLMAVKPHSVMTASFQMSFAATAALVGAYGAYARRRAERARDEPRRRGRLALVVLAIAALGLSSLIAGMATGPFAAYHFQRVAPFSLIANLVAMPIFSFWIMPLALLSVVAMPFGLDAPLLMLLGFGLTCVFEIARVLAEWFPDRASSLMTGQALLLMTLAVLAASFFASAFRWVALPLAALGFWLAPVRAESPELLIFEDGKEVALLAREGGLRHRKARPSGFVADQWERAYGAPAGEAGGDPDEAASPFLCEEDFCRATTRSGLKVVWTEDYERTGQACDEADIAIVSRAIRLDHCRSGAHLVTLRTLRRTGSLAISASAETGQAVVTRSIAGTPREWNLHRLEPWPEYWRKPDSGEGPAE